MNTATQPTAGATRRTPKRKAAPVWPLRRPVSNAESNGSFWAVHAIEKTLMLEALEADWHKRIRRLPDVLSQAISASTIMLEARVKFHVAQCRDAGGLLFCWEGSSVMHTPIPAVQP